MAFLTSQTFAASLLKKIITEFSRSFFNSSRVGSFQKSQLWPWDLHLWRLSFSLSLSLSLIACCQLGREKASFSFYISPPFVPSLFPPLNPLSLPPPLPSRPVVRKILSISSALLHQKKRIRERKNTLDRLGYLQITYRNNCLQIT